MTAQFKQYALVTGRRATREQVEPYLPKNYRVEWVGEAPATERRLNGEWVPYLGGEPVPSLVISGRDNAGWTLHGYVIPRLGSGMIRADEIDLTHPVFKQISVE